MGFGGFFKSIVGAIVPAAIAFFTGGIGSAGLVLVMAGVNGLLARAPKVDEGASFQQLRDNLVAVRQSAVVRDVIYGEVRTAGCYTFLHTTGTNNEFMHIVRTVAGHRIKAFGALYFDGVEVPLDGNGDATGTFAGHVHVEYKLGAAGEPAFPGLVAAAPDKWTAAHRQDGCASAYIRLKQDSSKFPNGIPNISFDIIGRDEIYDPVTETTGYTSNWAHVVADFLTNQTFGLGCSYDGEIHETSLTDSATNSDEMVGVVAGATSFTAATSDVITLAAGIDRLRRGDGVTVATDGVLPAPLAAATGYYWIPLSPTTGRLATSLANARAGTAIDLTDGGVGTHTITRVSEPRYQCNGMFKFGVPQPTLEMLLSAGAGRAPLISGEWHILSGRYIAPPAVALTRSDLRAGYTVTTRRSRRDIFNGVKGVYISPENAWQPSDFPPVTPADYLAEDDNERIWFDANFQMTSSSSACQRIGLIELGRIRRQITVELAGKMSAYPLAVPGYTVKLTLPEMGWNEKVFDVLTGKLAILEDANKVPYLGFDPILQETDESVFAWNGVTDEIVAPPAPTTSLVVAGPAPSNLTVDVGTYYSFGSLTFNWDVSNAPFVANHVLEARFEADDQWTVIGTPTAARLESRNAYMSGDWFFRVKTIGVNGIVSDYATATVTVGPPSVMPRVTGLELRGNGGNSAQFTGKDAKFVWRESSQTASYDLGAEPQGGDSGARDLYFKDFEVRVIDPATGEEVRREHTLNPWFDYTFEKNAEDYVASHDGEAGAFRTFKLEVYQRGQQNQISGIPARITVSNPAPPLPDNLVLVADHHHLIVVHSRPAGVLDWEGIQVFASTVDGFTPDDDSLVHQGAGELISVTLLPETTYYVRVRSYDSFGMTGLAESGQTEITTGAIGTTYIADAAIVAAKIADLAVTTAKIDDLAVTEAKIDALAVTTAKINNAAITNAKIATAAVQTANIADANITSAKIADANITSAKIGTAAVTSAKIGDLQVTTAKIDDNAVTASAYNDGTTSATVSVTATGTPIVIFASIIAGVSMSGTPNVTGNRTYDVTGYIRIRRNGSQIYAGPAGSITAQATYSLVSGSSFSFVSGVNGLAQTFFVDTPSAGSYTYVVDLLSTATDTDGGLTATIVATDAIELAQLFKK